MNKYEPVLVKQEGRIAFIEPSQIGMVLVEETDEECLYMKFPNDDRFYVVSLPDEAKIGLGNALLGKYEGKLQ